MMIWKSSMTMRRRDGGDVGGGFIKGSLRFSICSVGMLSCSDPIYPKGTNHSEPVRFKISFPARLKALHLADFLSNHLMKITVSLRSPGAPTNHF